MGCDFYIDVYLEIEHINGISYYEFPTIRGYYSDLLDFNVYNDSDDSDDSDNSDNSDDDSIEIKLLYEKIREIYLTPKKPLVIYNNNLFTSPKFKEKYTQIIQDIINKNYVNKYPRYRDTGTFSSIEQIIKITKKESRYD
jgi:hypothetical protein